MNSERKITDGAVNGKKRLLLLRERGWGDRHGTKRASRRKVERRSERVIGKQIMTEASGW